MDKVENLIRVPVVEGKVVLTSGFRVPSRPNHHGVDFGARPRGNPPILAFDDGVITKLDRNSVTAGKWLEITHFNGLISTYMHMDTIPKSLHLGVQVNRGLHIGTMGTTGASTGIHLHFELRRARARNSGLNAVNPMPYLLKEDTMQLQSQRWRINGQMHKLDGVTVNDRRLIGGRQLAEALGAVVGWEAETNTATVDMPVAEAGRTLNLARMLNNVTADQWSRVEAIIRE